ncbi:hypothetical protein EHI8A_059910 [Entamoeba histolytica HM-1:IMSS-B]|uniref:Uncharacterized protein n=6 Tax=Entamoeba histolytica TaxID=5759 RepID=C4LTB9_ENTH1|nr:hypothetical protein EHI_045040 [Entamoeba histolytica HM-1:IMSS]EMD48914.1 Hypothetical protein EHI5A_027040 [Entamoeba histolytica KU27]EMH74070.1 hypothetical protein EHI8A_059910 [Entamoeba histolytica HM-1:IMSS-B]EMS13634.1 hypothetical protein KM1_112380 [Entamoeba histolytica HM-3:IMSS]ENY60805.1 hypothetical protein EHI7A_058120 [Entamoeba histolytica HM-1:IMSS-A]GAT91801.1 hypothetical protein CL6EHI_045040 [Entamoeba histolytica]|eukprot:XP_657256.1 hypothetical protein EHI_045040 [Entamoeba histolytica HM-1:IMSS]
MSYLENVFLRNIVFYFINTKTIKTFCFISKRCQEAVISVYHHPYKLSKETTVYDIFNLFPKLETIRVNSFHDEISKTILSKVKLIDFQNIRNSPYLQQFMNKRFLSKIININIINSTLLNSLISDMIWLKKLRVVSIECVIDQPNLQLLLQIKSLRLLILKQSKQIFLSILQFLHLKHVNCSISLIENKLIKYDFNSSESFSNNSISLESLCLDSKIKLFCWSDGKLFKQLKNLENVYCINSGSFNETLSTTIDDTVHSIISQCNYKITITFNINQNTQNTSQIFNFSKTPIKYMSLINLNFQILFPPFLEQLFCVSSSKFDINSIHLKKFDLCGNLIGKIYINMDLMESLSIVQTSTEIFDLKFRYDSIKDSLIVTPLLQLIKIDLSCSKQKLKLQYKNIFFECFGITKITNLSFEIQGISNKTCIVNLSSLNSKKIRIKDSCIGDLILNGTNKEELYIETSSIQNIILSNILFFRGLSGHLHNVKMKNVASYKGCPSVILNIIK